MSVFILRFPNVDMKVRVPVIQQERYPGSMFLQCWSIVYYYFKLLKQHLLNVSCVLDIINYMLKLKNKNRAAKIFVVLIHWDIHPTLHI